jgi:hypothetical protein
VVARAVIALTLLLLALFAAWGTWLLATDDSDGGRHPVGWFLVAVAAAGFVVVAIGTRFRRR